MQAQQKTAEKKKGSKIMIYKLIFKNKVTTYETLSQAMNAATVLHNKEFATTGKKERIKIEFVKE